MRVRATPQNITKEGFTCNINTWISFKLHNAAVDWASIEEPDWQCGVFAIPNSDSMFDHRITFAKPFICLPLVMVCFNTFSLSGNWNIRTYTTNVDHRGFNLSIFKSDDGASSTRLWSASVTWVAIPGHDVLQRRNVWLGQYSTAEMGEIGADDAWAGHVDFGFQFRRPPKVFLGLNHFNLDNARNMTGH